MWFFTTCGFYSVAVKPDDEAAGTVTLRARARTDLETLREWFMPELGAVQSGDGSDYPFRARIERQAFAEGLKRLALAIDYGNFKNAVFNQQGPHRARIYAKVWRDLIELEDEVSQAMPAYPDMRMAWRLAKTLQRFREMHGHWPDRIQMPRSAYNLLLLDVGQLWHKAMLDKLLFIPASAGLMALDEAGLSTEFERDRCEHTNQREALAWLFS